VVLPSGCEAHEVVVGPLSPCECPEIEDVTVQVEGCAGAGGFATVTVTGATSQDIAGCEFRWDFGDGSPEETTPTPTHAHTYAAPGAYSGALLVKCGDCITLTPFTVEVPPCCPVVTGLSATIEGCASADGATASVTLVAATDPPSAAGAYHWAFGDGIEDDTTVPTVTHTYATPGDVTAEVTFTPEDADETGCETTTRTEELTIPQCGDNTPPPPIDEGGGCKGLRWATVILTILASLALFVAICVPGAGSAFAYIAAGLAIGAAVLGVIWGIFCPKPCGWGWLLAWQIAMGTGIGALYFAPCCPWLWVVGAALIAAAVVLVIAWVRECAVTFCQLMVELAVVLAGVILPVLGWIAGIPFLAACINPIVAASVSTLSGLVTLALARCATD
jgi:hypothetical protein